jgi:ABC-type glutathione transport system ATPase component
MAAGPDDTRATSRDAGTERSCALARPWSERISNMLRTREEASSRPTGREGPAIQARGLVMRYGDREVLHGIDLVVPQVMVVGFLGPNGAGKTTTVEILEGYRRRTGGQASALGMDPAGGRWHRGQPESVIPANWKRRRRRGRPAARGWRRPTGRSWAGTRPPG